ncbi:MAG: GNAT family N-acetyltransferase [Gemmatimonadales bacterium]
MNAPITRRRAEETILPRDVAPETFVLRRVFAERLTSAHLPMLRRMDGNSRMMASLGGVRSDAETKSYLERNLAHWDRHGFGIWILRDPNTGQVMGRAGLRHLEVEGTPEVELAYALMPEFWGLGLATDAARACVTIAREWLGLSSVVALTRADNLASQRVLLKAGFVPEREAIHRGLTHVMFRTE